MSDTTIVVGDDGPYAVFGEFVVRDGDGNDFPVAGEAYLCRCGPSSEKPFCDGTHNAESFDSAPRA